MGEAVLKIQPERAYWFVVRGDDLVGPLMSTQLLEQLRGGAVGPSDFCWKEGFAEWRPLASVSEFGDESRGKTFSVVSYPKLAIPSQKSSDTSKRRRASDNMTLLSLAPENRKVVQVNFAKTRVRRLSLYEWAFAMAFAVVCTYVGSKLTLDAVIGRMEQLRQTHNVAGKFQRLGAAADGAYVLPEFAAHPLLSAPSWSHLNYQPTPGQIGALERPAMTFVAYQSGTKLGTATWKIDAKFQANVWDPAQHDLDTVYHRPIQTTGLVPYTNSSSLNLVLRGEPYLY